MLLMMAPQARARVQKIKPILLYLNDKMILFAQSLFSGLFFEDFSNTV